MSTRPKPQLRPHLRQRGMALISGLLLLLVATILAMSMFRGYGTQQKIAGNVREKQRALSAAISAQKYAEYWLSSAAPPAAADCTGIGVSAIPQVCSNSPNFTSVPWTLGTGQVGVSFTNFNVTASVNQTMPTKGTYYGTPQFYVTDLGQSAAAGSGEVYQIDASAWGGTSDTVAVVESTYLITPSGHNYDK